MSTEADFAAMISSLASVKDLSPADQAEVAKLQHAPESVVLPAGAASATSTAEGSDPLPLKEDDPIVVDLRAKIREMTIPQKVKLALLGNSVCRMLLVSDSNRLIQEAVLKNPRLGPTEIESFAKNTNVSEFVLREISNHKEWLRAYSIKVGLVFNPKTPGDVSLKLMRFLNANELRRLSKSKSVSQLVSTTARKRLAELDK